LLLQNVALCAWANAWRLGEHEERLALGEHRRFRHKGKIGGWQGGWEMQQRGLCAIGSSGSSWQSGEPAVYGLCAIGGKLNSKAQ
jgi:hypothetical protein